MALLVLCCFDVSVMSFEEIVVFLPLLFLLVQLLFPLLLLLLLLLLLVLLLLLLLLLYLTSSGKKMVLFESVFDFLMLDDDYPGLK